MKKSLKQFCLVAVLSLSIGVLWQNSAVAATIPKIVSLSQLREGLTVPTRIDLDQAGNLYVADSRLKVILKFDMYGRKVAEYAGLAISGGMAVTADGSKIYVAEEKSVAILDGKSGVISGYLGGGKEQFGYAYDLDLDGQGFIFVADAESLNVKVYDPQGRFQYSFGGRGTGDGLFGGFSALTVNIETNEVFVADSKISDTIIPRVQVFDLSGKFLRKISGANGFGSVALYNNTGIAFDQTGRGYFLDGTKSRFVVLGLPTTYLTAYANAGFTIGKLQAPWDIVFDSVTNRLFVLCGDGRVEIFGIDGGTTPIRVNVAPGLPRLISPVASSEAASARPELVFANAVDPDGDPLTYQVRVLNGTQIVAEQSGIAEGEGSTTVTVSSALAENARHTWTVQASDGTGVSGWTEPQPFWVNAVEESPSAPALVAPDQGEVLDGSGVLSWASASDPDPFDTISYVLEVSSDAAFGRVVINEVLDGTSISLADCSGYPAMEDGNKYWWRVRAVDNHKLSSTASPAGSFIYDTTELRVSATLPGASVYLGGNLAYPGQFLGQAPVVLRDLSPGDYSIVVERSGAEPFVAQLTLTERQNTQVRASLRPAVAPDLSSFRYIGIFGGVTPVSGASPFIVDFDNDGYSDLLLGREEGGVLLYRGLPPRAGNAPLPEGVDLGIAVAGAAPFVADWNNDGLKDLMIGSADGTVRLFLNGGTEKAPVFGESAALNVVSGALQVKGPAVPVVLDYDGDGAKDLVVGTGDGEIVLFANVGNDQVPQLADGRLLATMTSAAAPFFADWDADGRRDLLVAAGGAIHLYPRLADGSLETSSILLPAPTGKGKVGASRLFVADLAEGEGKDVLIGSGQVLLVPSKGKSFLPAALAAAKAKVGEIRALSEREAPKLLAIVSALAQALDREDMTSAVRSAGELVRKAPVGGTTAAAAAELEAFLR